MESKQTERIIKNIPIRDKLHKKVKKYAGTHGMTVSGLTTRALIEYLEKRVKNFSPQSCIVHDCDASGDAR